MDYREEDKRAEQLIEGHNHTWDYDPGDPSVGIRSGWYCTYYNAWTSCEALPTDAEIEELEQARWGDN